MRVRQPWARWPRRTGWAAMGGAWLVRRLPGRFGPVALIVAGGAQLTLAYALAALYPSLTTLTLAVLLLGGGWAFLHSMVQAWATLLVPTARATGVAFFGLALYLGSSLGTGLAAGPVQHASFQVLFGVGTLVSLPLAALAAHGRRQYGDGGGARGRSGAAPGAAPRATRPRPSDPRTDGHPTRRERGCRPRTATCRP
ncbi:hypothetical protein ACFYNY_35465 [Streptomyces sp. NPDC006530]|uniref:hypothetical protein n=1 Tax=Streptomyces sp. NPDC006530 TaxID=3364750 RepID=UPI00369A779E